MKKVLLSLVLVLIATMAQGQTWINTGSNTPTEISASIISSNSQTIQVQFAIGGFYIENITVDSTTYQRLSIPRAGTSNVIGYPELPIMHQMIAIPECDDVSISYQVLQEQELNGYTVYPSPDYLATIGTDSIWQVEEVFSKNLLAYTDNTVYPSSCTEISEIGFFRSQKYVEVKVSPIRYNPATQKLYVASLVEVTISLTNATGATSANLGIFNNVAAHTMLNYESTGMTAEVNDMRSGNGHVKYFSLTSASQVDTIVADYLMICASHLFDEEGVPCAPILELAQHRATYNGYDVVILNVDNILEQAFSYQNYDYRIEEKLRSCIANIYRHGTANHTYDGHLGFVLMVGKAPRYKFNINNETNFNLPYQGFVPTGYQHGVRQMHGSNNSRHLFPSDYWFSCIVNSNGSLYYDDDCGDFYIGRICLDNSDDAICQLNNAVKKIVKRERRFNPRVRNLVDAAVGSDWSITDDFFVDFQSIIGEHRALVRAYYEDLQDAYIDSVKSMIKRGAPFLAVQNHGHVDRWNSLPNSPGNYDNSLTMNQFCFSHSCWTGCFDTTVNCFGQRMTVMDSQKGFVGVIASGRVINQTSSMDLNLPRAIYNHLSHIAGEALLETNLNLTSNDDRYKYNLIGDPALNIMATGFEVTDVITLADSTDITNHIVVKDGGVLKIPDGGIVRIHKKAGISVNATGCIHFIGDATFRSVDNNDAFLYINGGLVTNDIYNQGTITLKNMKLRFSNPAFDNTLSYNLSNYRLFATTVTASCLNLSFLNCNFNNESNLYASYSQLGITNCRFNKSGIVVSANATIGLPIGGDVPATSAYISGSLFDGFESFEYHNPGNDRGISYAAIRLESVPNYTLSGDTIVNCSEGINMTNSGAGTQHGINGNIIQNNGQGVIVYNSYANLSLNKIIGNGSNSYGNGLSIYNNSLTQVGSESGNSLNYQEIGLNCGYQLYASNNAFPQLFRYNKVIGDKYGQNVWIYYDNQGIWTNHVLIDVENNNWDGNINFNANVIFNNPSLFDWVPVWNIAKSENELSTAEALYNQAEIHFTDSLYIQAQMEFLQLVSEYPDDPLAVSALKELFRVKGFIDEDYEELKYYYLSDETIQRDSALQKVAGFLSARCDVREGNYPEALDWYASQLADPHLSYQDSVFCVIDIGDIYLMMQTDSLNKAAVPLWYRNHPELLPTSRYKHEVNTEILLSTLPMPSSLLGSPEYESQMGSASFIESISPNPAKDEVSIKFRLEKNCNFAEIRIINIHGETFATNNLSSCEMGKHEINQPLTGMGKGLYFCVLYADGELLDAKRIILQ